MENRFYNKKNGLWYERQGDYFLPCFTLPEEENKPIGIWGRRRLRYIQQHKKGLYTELLTTCTLNSHLAQVDARAEALSLRLVEQFAVQEGVTENLKAENPMLWVQRMNSVRARVEEVVFAQVVFV